MHLCKHCEQTIDDPETAIFDGASWFCDALCHAKYLQNVASRTEENTRQ